MLALKGGSLDAESRRAPCSISAFAPLEPVHGVTCGSFLRIVLNDDFSTQPSMHFLALHADIIFATSARFVEVVVAVASTQDTFDVTAVVAVREIPVILIDATFHTH